MSRTHHILYLLALVFWGVVPVPAFGVTPVAHDVLPQTVVPGGASVAYTHGYVPWGNPASAVGDSSVVLQIGYENRYFSPELSDEYLAVTITTRYFNLSASYNFFGLALYHEMMAALTVSRKFGRFAIGVEADYFNYYDAEAVRYHHAFTAQVGVMVDVTRRFTLGFRAFNPTFSQIRLYDVPRRLPVIFDLGGNYRFYDRLDLLFQLGYVVSNGVRWAVGAEYDIKNCLVAKIGVRGYDYVVPMVGAAVRFYGFRFDLAVEADFRIGMSLMSNLQYCF